MTLRTDFVRPARHGTPGMPPLRLGFLTPHNPYDRQSFSGTAWHARAALASLPGVQLRVLGPHRPPRPLDRWRARIGQAPPVPEPGRIDTDGLDAVVGLVATSLLAALPPDVPVIHVSDATPGLLADLYDRAPDADAVARERRLAARAQAVIYSSREIAERARTEFALGPGFVPRAVPFGTNLDRLPDRLARPPGNGPLRLLTVITDWQRKGGALALETLGHLRAAGIDATLTVVGAAPRIARPGLVRAGWLDKTDPAAAARLSDLYARSHLFVLPTRGDCTPMVLAEAMAHGLPVLATRVGGIGSVVAPGTGTLLPPEADAPHWAAAIRDLACDRTSWQRMARGARSRAAARLTWSAWARDVVARIDATSRPSEDTCAA